HRAAAVRRVLPDRWPDVGGAGRPDGARRPDERAAPRLDAPRCGGPVGTDGDVRRGRLRPAVRPAPADLAHAVAVRHRPGGLGGGAGDAAARPAARARRARRCRAHDRAGGAVGRGLAVLGAGRAGTSGAAGRGRRAGCGGGGVVHRGRGADGGHHRGLRRPLRARGVPVLRLGTGARDRRAGLRAPPRRGSARRCWHNRGVMTSLPLVFEAPRRAQPPRHLADLDPADRRAAVGELGLPGFRADQLARHYFGRLTADVGAMTDLPAAARDTLRELLPPLVTPVLEQACDDGATRKTLWQAHDGTRAESVLMGYPDRATVCVSSQAGCGMACPFCATGQGGLQRNLSTAEIVEQVRQAAAAARDGALGRPMRLSNVVFMGMGEPLANYKRVVAAVRRITAPAPDGLGISARGVTVSTVGLVPAIDRLANEGLPVTLAVSLHTPDDELRDTLVPVNNRWKVTEV